MFKPQQNNGILPSTSQHRLRSLATQAATRFGGIVASIVLTTWPLAAQASPNGTWLSKPQIWFHASNQTLDAVMARIKKEQYEYVFLDYRHVKDEMQQQVSTTARKHGLTPIVWIQSPQYRSMTVEDMIQEARHGDGIQVDDHFFTHYSQRDFQRLRARYNKELLCSIQPFQAAKVPASGCDQLDVQCYTPASFQRCLGLANRLNAVLSLSHTSTIRHQHQHWGRSHNVFLWPHTNDYVNVPVVNNPVTNPKVVNRPTVNGSVVNGQLGHNTPPTLATSQTQDEVKLPTETVKP